MHRLSYKTAALTILLVLALAGTTKHNNSLSIPVAPPCAKTTRWTGSRRSNVATDGESSAGHDGALAGHKWRAAAA